MTSLQPGGKNLSSETIPAWDGNSRNWRRYLKEVQWYVMGTKPSLRRYLASRLVSKLTGSARLLAMTWNLQEFDGPSGVKILLSKLSQSPLVRKSVPNAASIMGQYFAFRRNPGEAISSFLIREALHYEEFRECLVRLSEEKQSISPEAHGFGLPSLDEESSDTEDLPEEQESGGKSSQKASREGASPGISTRRGLYERIPQHDPHERAQPPGLYQPDPGDAMLSVADSFILGQLRGWRLLTSASLTSNEWRNVLGTTQGKLDYESISNALQVLYDEQMSMATRQPTSLPHGVHNMVQAFSLDDDWMAGLHRLLRLQWWIGISHTTMTGKMTGGMILGGPSMVKNKELMIKANKNNLVTLELKKNLLEKLQLNIWLWVGTKLRKGLQL